MKGGAIAIVALLLFCVFPALAGEALWTKELVHYDGGVAEWVIRPAVEPMKPETLKVVLDAIYSKGGPTPIHHIALGTLYTRPDLQSDVVEYLNKQELFRTSPPPFGHNRWGFKRSAEMQKLVSNALLQSRLVKSLNEELAGHKLKITSTAMEKLFFTKEDGRIVWHAIVWFKVQ